MQSEAIKSNIQTTLGQKTPQFIASVASLVANNPKLKECDQNTILSACLIAASLDLPINQNLGFAYIIPYNMQAQFQIGYKGFIQLAMRSGQFKTINVSDVREGEIESIDRLTGSIKFNWSVDNRDSKKVVGFVGYMELINGFTKQLYMSNEEISKHGIKYSKTYKQGFGLWKNDFNAMAQKTVIKLLLSKYAPMTVEMQTAALADQAVIDGEKYEYIDNEPVQPQEQAQQKEIDRIIKHITESKTLGELQQCEDALAGYDLELVELYNAKKAELGAK